MRRLPLSSPLLHSALALGLLLGFSAQASDQYTRMRADCRFYRNNKTSFCYSSAIYSVSGHGIHDIRLGVGCDYETIFDDDGISSPEEQLTDSLRPRTSAIPRVEISPQGSLRHPGTYTAKLEIASGSLTDGVCYVREVGDGEGSYDLMATAEAFDAEINGWSF